MYYHKYSNGTLCPLYPISMRFGNNYVSLDVLKTSVGDIYTSGLERVKKMGQFSFFFFNNFVCT